MRNVKLKIIFTVPLINLSHTHSNFFALYLHSRKRQYAPYKEKNIIKIANFPVVFFFTRGEVRECSLEVREWNRFFYVLFYDD